MLYLRYLEERTCLLESRGWSCVDLGRVIYGLDLYVSKVEKQYNVPPASYVSMSTESFLLLSINHNKPKRCGWVRTPSREWGGGGPRFERTWSIITLLWPQTSKWTCKPVSSCVRWAHMFCVTCAWRCMYPSACTGRTGKEVWHFPLSFYPVSLRQNLPFCWTYCFVKYWDFV